MLNQRIAIEFESEADDAVWDEAGNLLIPGGKRVAEGISEFLRTNGVEVSLVSQRSFFGWEFSLTYRKHRILAVVQHAEKWLVVLGETRLLPNLFLRSPTRSPLDAVGSIIKQAIETKGFGRGAKVIEFQ